MLEKDDRFKAMVLDKVDAQFCMADDVEIVTSVTKGGNAKKAVEVKGQLAKLRIASTRSFNIKTGGRTFDNDFIDNVMGGRKTIEPTYQEFNRLFELAKKHKYLARERRRFEENFKDSESREDYNDLMEELSSGDYSTFSEEENGQKIKRVELAGKIKYPENKEELISLQEQLQGEYFSYLSKEDKEKFINKVSELLENFNQ